MRNQKRFMLTICIPVSIFLIAIRGNWSGCWLPRRSLLLASPYVQTYDLSLGLGALALAPSPARCLSERLKSPK